MQKVNLLHNKLTFIMLLSFLFIAFMSSAQDINKPFKPKIEIFDGYLIEVSADYKGESYYFMVFSKEPLNRIKFKLKNDTFYLRDTSVILVFYGSTYPNVLKDLYHNQSHNEWLSNISADTSELKEFKRCRYTLINRKVKFEAFSYNEYKPYEGTSGYAKLHSWGIYAKTIYPYMLKNNNPYYIICHFIK